MAPETPRYRTFFSYRTPRPIGPVKPVYVLFWIGLVAALAFVVTALHLPERMDCTGYGRYGHCKHGLLSPELWRRP